MFAAVQGGEGVRSDVHVPPAAEGDAGGQHLQAALLPHRQPHPAITWTKSGKPLPSDLFPTTRTDSVITIKIINCQPSDSGKYKCVATNSLGSDTTDCVVIVEGEYKYFLEIKYFSATAKYF